MQLTVRSLSRKASAGLAMLEALAALLILTAGAVGVLWWQQQATLRQQQQTYQFIAMALASDLADRMRINASQSALYAMHWGSHGKPHKTVLPMLAAGRNWRNGISPSGNKHYARNCQKVMHRSIPCVDKRGGGLSAWGGQLTRFLLTAQHAPRTCNAGTYGLGRKDETLYLYVVFKGLRCYQQH